MDQLKQRRKEVRELRSKLERSLDETRDRLSPAQLFEDILDVIDSKRHFLVRVQSGIERNPLMAVLLLAGAAWLISDRSSSNRRKQLEESSAIKSKRKGDDHGSQHNRDQRPDFHIGEKQSRPEL